MYTDRELITQIRHPKETEVTLDRKLYYEKDNEVECKALSSLSFITRYISSIKKQFSLPRVSYISVSVFLSLSLYIRLTSIIKETFDDRAAPQ